MGTRIIWKPSALKQLREIEHYIKNEFGKAILDKFLDDLFETTELLRTQPEFGRDTKVRGVRRIKVYKKTSLFYRIYKGDVVVLRASDVRENPEKNPYLRKK